jgi:hypothetical protein
MSYIGEQPRFSEYPSQLISPNGTDTSFTLTNSVGNPGQLIVSISGVKQSVNAYAVTGTTIDFGVGNPPPAGTLTLEIIYLGLRSDYVLADQTQGGTINPAIMRTNGQTIDQNMTVATTVNAVSGGPITITSPYVVTVNGNWSVV